MNDLLQKSGYLFDSAAKVWVRERYASIDYSDGDETEKRIGRIINQVKDRSVLSSELRRLCTDWPSLYHLSGARANILRPFASLLSGDILEIGAGCGAITRYLGESGANVLALEGSLRRATITRARTSDLANVTVLAESFEHFVTSHQFEVVTLIGVLEYANMFMSGDNPTLSMLNRVRSLLKPDGRLIIAIENQLGLKYFAGALEDHVGQSMYGVEGRYRQDQPQTFGRKVLADILGQAGFESVEFMAPFPDYKRPVSIVTEEGFATQGFDAAAFAWQSVRRDWQLPEYCAFSLELAWPELVKNGLALDVANSFLIAAAPSVASKNESVLAYHFSTERIPAYCKETLFVREGVDAVKVVCRCLGNDPHEEHDTTKSFVRFHCPTPQYYSKGEILSWQFVQIATRDGWMFRDVGQFIQRYVALLEILVKRQGLNVSLTHSGVSLPGSFFDYVPQNIIVRENGEPEVIDTEWSVVEDFTLGQLLLRAMWTLEGSVTRFGQNGSRRPVLRVEMMRKSLWAAGFVVTDNDFARFFERESLMQEQVAGVSMRKYFADWATLFLPTHNLSLVLAERDRLISQLEESANERENQISHLHQAIRERDAEISSWYQYRNEVLSSMSWKVTRPLRVLVRRLKKVFDKGYTDRKKGDEQACLQDVQHREDDGRLSFLGKISCRAAHLLAPRVLIIAELSISQCKKYRVEQKKEMFKSLGVDCSVLSWTETDACMNALSTHTHVIFYRVPAFDSVSRLFMEAERLGVQTAWEVDDLIFDREILAASKNLAELDDSTVQGVLDGAVLYRTAMLSCEMGIASTQGLALAMQKAGVAEVFVVENALDRQTLFCADTIRKGRKNLKDGIIRIVYGSGTDTHNVDFREAAPAILSILERFPNVRLRLIGTLELPETFAPFQKQIERIPFCSFDEYLHCLAECDISIAPLEDYIFNDAKSNIKFLEAAVLQMPSVCSPRAAFRQAITNGDNGFLCSTDDEWSEALAALVSDVDLRHKIGSAAYQTVISSYSHAEIAKQQLLPFLRKQARPDGKMRILTVNVFYRPRSFGGATVVAEELNKIINQNTFFEIFVFTTLPQDVVPEYTVRRYEVEGVTVFGAGLPNLEDAVSQFENLQMLEPFEQVLLAVKPDLVHFHSIQGIGVAVADLCVARGIRYIVTLHDAWWLCGRQFMVDQHGSYCNQEKIDLLRCSDCVDDIDLNRYRQKKLFRVLENADLLLAPSQYFADFYRRNGFADDKVLVNKNGIRQPISHRKIRVPGPLRFGYVGGNTEIKGVHLVKKVFAELTGLPVKLVVVDNTLNLGCPSYNQDFLEGLGNVEVVPAYTQGSMEEFFSSIDVLLFPTQWKESFGLTVREALARNVWVIATDAGGVVEDICPGKNGFIVPFTDSGEALRQSILDTIDLYKRFQVGEEICLGATKIRWFAEQAEELAGVYKSIVDDKKWEPGNFDAV